MKSAVGHWKGTQVSVELVNELSVTGTIKAIDKAGLLIEVAKNQQRYIPITAIVQVIRKKSPKAKDGATKK
jgi:small nuclear ribonucleoprotein (snRNP)-like protein